LHIKRRHSPTFFTIGAKKPVSVPYLLAFADSVGFIPIIFLTAGIPLSFGGGDPAAEQNGQKYV
jgi:hypothetical protein